MDDHSGTSPARPDDSVDRSVPPLTARRESAERVLGQLGRRLIFGEGPSLGPFDPEELGDLVGAASGQRVRGLLAGGVSAGVLALAGDQVDEVAHAHRDAMAISLVLEQMLCRLHGWLSDAGIDHVVLKGPAIAHTAYEDPSLREFGDLDLLVPSEQIDRALAMLLRRGASRAMGELAPGWDRHFAKSITMSDRSGYEIDLHRTIAPGVFGLRIDPAELFARTQGFMVGGRQMRALPPDAQLLQACVHTAAGNRRVWLSSVCDIAQLAASGKVNLERFHSMATRWRLAAVVERATEVVRERLDGTDVSALTDGLRITEADRRHLSRYGGGFPGPAITGFAALPLGQWVPYARALAWPSRQNLTDRGLTRRSHLRRLANHVTVSQPRRSRRPGGSRVDHLRPAT